ncbi:MAG: nucleotidyltransferase domain-containing protein [Candidatus Methanoperedens sp.]|jgi:predicted nucleotidyltransferase|nr:nucleotidyltransferase domain-containing protein [Candidatus Methanoperedens sp.]PKL54196.1 MAG: hypothetical protein CVV36_03055 [Candidatus Methanoperedenaceae archaeon HGW-Methanoperedenaceae-1]
MNQTDKAKTIIKTNIFEILQNAGTSARIILFGSRAREDSTRFSDYDILLITDRTIEIKKMGHESDK